MSNLKEIRTRIASVESTKKITSAMKLVSAAKLRRAQNAISNLRPYSRKLNEILQNLSGKISEENPLFKVRKPENVVLVAITSNRGLCGAFNSNIIKEIDQIVNKEYLQQLHNGTLKLICIGEKATEQLKKKYEVMYANSVLLDTPRFEEIATISSHLMNDFVQNKIDKVEVVYNRFVNAATQNLTRETFLPVTDLATSSEKSLQTDYILEPSQEELVNELIPKILILQLYKTLLDSIASEHGARMTAMAKATDNATEIIKDLKLKYNNARQAAITNELNEIVSGAEALKNL